ncbi:Cytochrome oxidase biogenesis protein Sco1/SenC/PrrC, putative copper metallochaperone, partial [Pseudomonas fluorescens]
GESDRRASGASAVARLSGADQTKSRGADADYLAGRHVPRHPRRRAVDGAGVWQSRHCAVRGRRGGGQSCGRSAHRCGDGADAQATLGRGPGFTDGSADLCAGAGAARSGLVADLHQPADGVADPRIAPWLRGGLHRFPQTCDAAEHRHRRPRRRSTAVARLDRRHRPCQRRTAAAGADHLRLDAAALLGAGHPSQGGIRQGRYSDVAGDSRRALHQGAYSAVHLRAAGGESVAVRDSHERPALPDLRSRPRREVSAMGRGAVPWHSAARGDQHLQVLYLVLVPVVHRPARRPLLTVEPM